MLCDRVMPTWQMWHSSRRFAGSGLSPLMWSISEPGEEHSTHKSAVPLGDVLTGGAGQVPGGGVVAAGKRVGHLDPQGLGDVLGQRGASVGRECRREARTVFACDSQASEQ